MNIGYQLKNTILYTTTCLMALQMSTPSLAQDAPKWEGHIEAEGKISNERSIGEGSVFIPVWQDDTSMLFTDIRGKFDNKDSEEINLGLGYRRQINNNWILGGYAFYDRRNSGNDNTFHQATIGVEAMSEDLEFRINGYIPESTEEDVGSATSTASMNAGNFQIQSYGAPKERALPGVDIEVGKGFYLPENWEVWAYAGGYHFDASGYEDVTGPRGRIELSKNFDNGMRFTAGLESQTDDVRGGQTFGIARLRMPFSAFGGGDKTPSRNLSKLDQRMTTRIIRDVDIVSGEQQGDLLNTEAATFELDNGTKVSSFTTIDATGNIAADVTAAGANSLIVIDGSAGTINTGSTITTQTEQALIGGGATITVAGTSGTTASLTLPGSRPVINGTNAGLDVIRLQQESNRLQNLTIQGGNDGVRIANDDQKLKNLTIQNTGRNGIHVGDSDNIELDGIIIDSVNGGAGHGIFLDAYNDLSIKTSTIKNANFAIHSNLLVPPGSQQNLSFDNVTVDNVNVVYQHDSFIARFTSGAITATNVTVANCVNNGTITDSTLTINGVACP